ncbi:unnamed protein product, partial [Iphiclides podalirius]
MFTALSYVIRECLYRLANKTGHPPYPKACVSERCVLQTRLGAFEIRTAQRLARRKKGGKNKTFSLVKQTEYRTAVRAMKWLAERHF